MLNGRVVVVALPEHLGSVAMGGREQSLRIRPLLRPPFENYANVSGGRPGRGTRRRLENLAGSSYDLSAATAAKGEGPLSILRYGVVPSFGTRLPGIEGVRALAALSIVVLHVWAYSDPSGDSAMFRLVASLEGDLAFGVTLFFTLSGFLLYRPFVAALLRAEARPSFARYLWNRALRIGPAYWVILLVSALILHSTLVRSHGELVRGSIDDPIALAKQMLLLQSYEPSTVITGIAPAWSLSVEVVFYLALPLLALTAWMLARHATTRSGRRLAALAPAVLLLGIGLVGKTATWHFFSEARFGGWGSDWDSVLVRSFLCQADLFSFGMALAVVRVDVEDNLLRVSALGRKGIGALCLVAYLVTSTQTDSSETLGISPYNTLMALACALFLALVVLATPGERPMLVRLLELRPLVTVGLISYSLFLWHMPVISWLDAHDLGFSGRTGFVVTLFLTVAVGFAVSVLTYRLVELPALRRKRRYRREKVSLSRLEASAAP